MAKQKVVIKMKKVKDFMIRDLTSVTEDTPLKEATELLCKRKLCGVPVLNKQKEISGWISCKDIISSIFPEQVKLEEPNIISIMDISKDIKKLTQIGQSLVKDYMSKNVISVSEDAPASDVAKLILQKGIRRMPVSKGKRLLGTVGRPCLCRMLLEEGAF